MVQRHPLTVNVPIRGKVLVRLDGTEVLHEVGDFAHEVPVSFAAGAGEVSFQFEEKFWEGAIKNQPVGGRTPDPLPNPDLSTASIIEEVIVEDLQRWGTHDVGTTKLAIDGIIDLRQLSAKICAALDREGRLSA